MNITSSVNYIAFIVTSCSSLLIKCLSALCDIPGLNHVTGSWQCDYVLVLASLVGFVLCYVFVTVKPCKIWWFEDWGPTSSSTNVLVGVLFCTYHRPVTVVTIASLVLTTSVPTRPTHWWYCDIYLSAWPDNPTAVTRSAQSSILCGMLNEYQLSGCVILIDGNSGRACV